MRILEKKKEVQRAVRALKSSFESMVEDNPGARYNCKLSIDFPEPFANKTSSEIKSLLSVVGNVVAQFADKDQMDLTVVISPYSDYTGKLVEKARAAYEESQKLEGVIQQVQKQKPESTPEAPVASEEVKGHKG